MPSSAGLGDTCLEVVCNIAGELAIPPLPCEPGSGSIKIGSTLWDVLRQCRCDKSPHNTKSLSHSVLVAWSTSISAATVEMGNTSY
jgi:hypothetical protein